MTLNIARGEVYVFSLTKHLGGLYTLTRLTPLRKAQVCHYEGAYEIPVLDIYHLGVI